MTPAWGFVVGSQSSTPATSNSTVIFVRPSPVSSQLASYLLNSGSLRQLRSLVLFLQCIFVVIERAGWLTGAHIKVNARHSVMVGSFVHFPPAFALHILDKFFTLFFNCGCRELLLMHFLIEEFQIHILQQSFDIVKLPMLLIFT